MPMSPRLLRPRQTIHLEAADWANRVRTNGGSVSGTTLSAVDRFVKAIHAAGIRDRFYRLNLFCGTSDASLNAVRTPLFRGPSLTGTQYGNAIDTNVNFVQGDYAETGASGGLIGNSTSKILLTGLQISDIPSNNTSGHLAAYKNASMPFVRSLIGARNASNQTYRAMTFTTNSLQAAWAGAQTNTSADPVYAQSGLAVTNLLSGNLSMFWQGASAASAAASVALTTGASEIQVFSDGETSSITGSRLRGYSAGLGMTSQQAASFNAAMVAFQTALSRA